VDTYGYGNGDAKRNRTIFFFLSIFILFLDDGLHKEFFYKNINLLQLYKIRRKKNKLFLDCFICSTKDQTKKKKRKAEIFILHHDDVRL